MFYQNSHPFQLRQTTESHKHVLTDSCICLYCIITISAYFIEVVLKMATVVDVLMDRIGEYQIYKIELDCPRRMIHDK